MLGREPTEAVLGARAALTDPVESLLRPGTLLHLPPPNRHPNALTVTIRHVPADHSAALTVAPEDTFAVMTYLDQKIGTRAQTAMDAYAREVTGAALDLGGRPYVAYRNVATSDQLAAGYPGVGEFADTIERIDPDGLIQHKLRSALLEAGTAARRPDT